VEGSGAGGGVDVADDDRGAGGAGAWAVAPPPYGSGFVGNAEAAVLLDAQADQGLVEPDGGYADADWCCGRSVAGGRRPVGSGVNRQAASVYPFRCPPGACSQSGDADVGQSCSDCNGNYSCGSPPTGYSL